MEGVAPAALLDWPNGRSGPHRRDSQRRLRLALHWQVIDRGAFYAAAHCAMRRAGLASGTTRARRLAVRNAGLEVMQRFHVIERSRGGVPVPLPECEGIS